MIYKNLRLGLLALPLTLASTSRVEAADQQAFLSFDGGSSAPTLQTMTSGGKTRTYGISVPTGYTKDGSAKWPMIVDFHGRNGSPQGQWDNSQYYLNSVGSDYIVVYPLGCLGAGNKHGGDPETAWQGAPYADPSCDDLTFTQDLVNKISTDYGVDTKRIFASGKSNGAGFVGTLACSPVGDVFAAFAMASAALYTDSFLDPWDCTGARPRHIMEAHGVMDKIIPIDGRKDLSTPNIARWTRRWGERNGCDPDEDRTVSRRPWGYKTTYTCNGNVDFIQQYRIDNLGHCWASTVKNTDFFNQDGTCPVPNVDYTAEVLAFFARYGRA